MKSGDFYSGYVIAMNNSLQFENIMQNGDNQLQI